MNFDHVRAGDIVTRMLAGTIPMNLRVAKVDDTLIYCGGESAWTFDRKTGIEVDHDLGWGPQYGVTGSYLVSVESAAPREAPADEQRDDTNPDGCRG